MHRPEPRPTRWDLHWRMFGADFRVHPFFWATSALMGVYYYQHPTDGGVGVFAYWMLAVFFSILLHELGHVVAARMFGVRGQVHIAGLGGRLLNLAELKYWQRALVLLAGPLTSWLIVGILWLAACEPVLDFLQQRGWAELFVNAVRILMVSNFWWGLLNLLPVWPLDGGQLAVDTAEKIRGRSGIAAAALLSILVVGGLTVWMGLEMRLRLLNRFDPLYLLRMEEFAILTVYCFIFWTKGFRLLWGDAEPFDDDNKSGRAA